MNTNSNIRGSNKENYRILAENCMMNNDTWVTGLNNNDIVIGPSGSGKTRSYVKPNILQCNESMIIADTKGSVQKEVEVVLKQSGYKVINIDFTDCFSSYGYNPLDYVRYDEESGKYREQDIMTVSACIIPLENTKEPVWDLSARMYLESIIAYVFECLPEEEHTLGSVVTLFNEMSTGRFDIEFSDAEMMFNNWTSDAEVTHFLRWDAHKTIDDTKVMLEQWIDGYQEEAIYYWGIYLKDGEMIGSIGITITSEYDLKGELGYKIGSHWWNQGYSSEAAKALL